MLLLPLVTICSLSTLADDGYKNFDVSVYARVFEVIKMKDPVWLKTTFEQMDQHLNIDKIYLETHRDMTVIDEAALEPIIRFFKSKGIKTAGGITITVSESNNFETYCYTNEEHRKKLKQIVEMTARHFDELILDDFFYTSCKCKKCIAAKGDKSWSQFRMDLLAEAAKTLIVGPAKAVNPKIKVVIKYPNWYEHFQGLGFDLERGPKIFDGIYTGTETRDSVMTDQHLQEYQSYQIIRYFENIAPGRNGGGWVDTYASNTADRYAEQLWLTLLAKAPEMTMFDYMQMGLPVTKQLRGPWQGTETSFDFDAMIKPYLDGDKYKKDANMALIAATALEQIDNVIGYLGRPIGIKGYKPYHSTGEDFLHNFLGMAGIPIDLYPEFPSGEKIILLTESAKFDAEIINKIKGQLINGKDVVITSGFLCALMGKGIEEIVELQYTNRKAIVKDFKAGWGGIIKGEKEMIIPQIQYLTNDSWEEVSALDNGLGWPILHRADYADGNLYVLTIPDNFADIYDMPDEVLNKIRDTLLKNQFVRLHGPAKVSIFLYDNNTAVVHSFGDTPADIRLVAPKGKNIKDIETGEALRGKDIQGFWGRPSTEKTFELTVKPHSFRVLSVE
ncbi:MAG: hypothetical protein JW927_22370 [Deltaproteobacteria bacterium]|nr:hypothetical protein [Deltaproteobacteria bacterium]